MTTSFDIYEATIEDTLAALDAGTVTAVELVAAHLARVARYDRAGIRFNAIPILNPTVFAEAAESDRRRQQGEAGPLEGIPFTVKDSYLVKGLSVASGSPAFATLTAQHDAFTVQRIREAGGVLIGKTNMPPMADGGMQRGLYGRTESPYNGSYLPAAYASGSSHGSGVATAANFALFGMGEETVSSGRSPASNNGLCAYTPSRGIISIRGNWPLFPTRDVVVPHTRSMVDMLALLDVIVVDDDETAGDFWREQTAVTLPLASAVRPASYQSLRNPRALEGRRIGVPRMYLGDDPKFPIEVRPSVLALWEVARQHLEGLGATVVTVDLPVVEKYEGDVPGGESLHALGILPPGWMDYEFIDLVAQGWETFLRENGDPALHTLANVDHEKVFPAPEGSLPDRYAEIEDYENRYRDVVALVQEGLPPVDAFPGFADALRAIERLRETTFERWLQENELDAIAFPANADVAPADADLNVASADLAWRNGVFFSNGNYVLRHLGIPTVTVAMGLMEDIRMPVGLTFAGAAYADNELLAMAYAFEQAAALREPAALAPPLPSDTVVRGERMPRESDASITVEAVIEPTPLNEGARLIRAFGTVSGPAESAIAVTINGIPVVPHRDGDHWNATHILPAAVVPAQVGGNPVISQAIVVAVVTTAGGAANGAFIEV